MLDNLYREIKFCLLVRRPFAVYGLADGEERVCAPVDKLIVRGFHAAQIDIPIVDKAMQVFVFCPSSEIFSVYAAILVDLMTCHPFRTIRIYSDLSKGAKAIGVDVGVLVIHQLQITGSAAAQGITAYDGVARKVDCALQLNAAAILGRIVSGDGASIHIHVFFDNYSTTAAFRSAFRNQAAVHGDIAILCADGAAISGVVIIVFGNAVSDLTTVDIQVAQGAILHTNTAAVEALVQFAVA